MLQFTTKGIGCFLIDFTGELSHQEAEISDVKNILRNLDTIKLQKFDEPWPYYLTFIAYSKDGSYFVFKPRDSFNLLYVKRFYITEAKLNNFCEEKGNQY